MLKLKGITKYAFLLLPFLMACSEDDPQFALLEDSAFFTGANNFQFNNKIDVLFVIDNSGSMSENQANLANNFDAFINDFTQRGYDFRIAIVGSDAWRENHGATKGDDSSYAEYQDRFGHGHVLTNNTPNLFTAFAQNILLGISGSGDERPLESMTAALSYVGNSQHDFLRPDSHLAVIIVSDEEDMSHPEATYKQTTGSGEDRVANYGYKNLYAVGTFINDLDSITGGGKDRYSVSAISIDPGDISGVDLTPGNTNVLNELSNPDSACFQSNNPWGLYGARIKSVVESTSGVFGNVCDASFANALELISTNITSITSKYCLSREPNVSTIFVQINGQTVPQDSSNGWSYNSSDLCMSFHGDAVPNQGDQILVKFDPLGAL